MGRELARTAPADVLCVLLAREELDIGDADACSELIAREAPQLLINAAAYTAVDLAESEPEKAYRVNGLGAGNLASACAAQRTKFIHVSTDFVFDGSASQPYPPEAATAPLGEYGRSKLAGEQAVQEAMPDALIVRTGWVYSAFGNNFVKTMLRLMAERDQLGVVDDQVGTPTWAKGLAQFLWRAAEQAGHSGVYHWSDAGVCSWYDFAVAIAEESLVCGLLETIPVIGPIAGENYPTPARRPSYSVLDKARSWQDFAVDGVHWRVQLRSMLKELKDAQRE